LSDDRPLHGIVYFCIAILLTATVDANAKIISAVIIASGLYVLMRERRVAAG